MKGSPLQGPIILIILTDCSIGEGGTCVVEGSHFAVYDYIQREGSITHERLNSIFKSRMRRVISSGDAFLVDRDEGVEGVKISQVKAKMGDVVLLHPLVVHSGTTNCADGKVR